MPTSHRRNHTQPWDPNPVIDPEDQERGYYADACYGLNCGPECSYCDGTGELRAPLPEYRPDRKIRCYLGLPNTSFNWLAWDAAQIADMRNQINTQHHCLVAVRGWDRNLYEIKPSAVHMFRQVDKDPLP